MYNIIFLNYQYVLNMILGGKNTRRNKIFYKHFVGY